MNVRFVDHTEELFQQLMVRVAAATAAAAGVLAEGYREALLRRQAPPHSKIGEIPKAYFGHRPKGYGPTEWAEYSGGRAINNPGQVDYLASYIDYSTEQEFGLPTASVGFRPAPHIGTPEVPGNYLLLHNESGRPWVVPVFDEVRSDAAQAASRAFNEAGRQT